MTLNDKQGQFTVQRWAQQWNQNRDGETERGRRINKEFELIWRGCFSIEQWRFYGYQRIGNFIGCHFSTTTDVLFRPEWRKLVANKNERWSKARTTNPRINMPLFRLFPTRLFNWNLRCWIEIRLKITSTYHTATDDYVCSLWRNQDN